MNQKECSLSDNHPQKMKMVILNDNLMRAAEAAFWKFSLGNLLPNSWSILRKTGTMGSKSVTVTYYNRSLILVIFYKFSKRLIKNRSQYNKHFLGVVYQAFK